MPDGDDSQVRSWAHDITGASDADVTREQVADAIAAYRELSERHRHRGPPVEASGTRATTCSPSFLAAEEDATLSTGRAPRQRHPALRRRSRDDVGAHRQRRAEPPASPRPAGASPSRAQPAPERDRGAESLRELGPVRMALRRGRPHPSPATAPATSCSRGTMAFVCCGSANRDPDHFGASAGELDIARADAKDGVSFGAGIHYCLGAHLARPRGGTRDRHALRRFPDLASSPDEPCWSGARTFRSLDRLLVTLH